MSNSWQEYKAKIKKRLFSSQQAHPSAPSPSWQREAPLPHHWRAPASPTAPKTMPSAAPNRNPTTLAKQKPTAPILRQGFSQTIQPRTSKFASPSSPIAINQLVTSRGKKRKKYIFPVEGRLDLHGMTADQAFANLSIFFDQMIHDHKRHLLIITGKGQGIMKKTLFQWIEKYGYRISTITPAPPADSNDPINQQRAAAFYITLKK